MTASERVFNVLAGTSVLFWGAMGAMTEPVSLVRCCIIGLQWCVGVLFLVRAPLKMGAPFSLATAAVGASFLVNGLAFKLSPSPETWAIPTQLLFAVGTFIAFFALVGLGRSFAVAPAVREIVVRGPYGWIRHPAYFGELLMLLACCVAAFPETWLALPAMAVCIASMVVRIVAEERVLLVDESYLAYQKHTPWRLMPGVW